MGRARERHGKGWGKAQESNPRKPKKKAIKRAKTCEKLKFLPVFGILNY